MAPAARRATAIGRLTFPLPVPPAERPFFITADIDPTNTTARLVPTARWGASPTPRTRIGINRTPPLTPIRPVKRPPENPIPKRPIILTPICPHTLSARPLIIGENDQVKITLGSSEEEVMVTIDGQEGFILEPNDEVIIKKSDHKAQLITFKEKSFYAILREKLRWSGQINE